VSEAVAVEVGQAECPVGGFNHPVVDGLELEGFLACAEATGPFFVVVCGVSHGHEIA
jgi:hypothetical protein